jgi:hypothetical protein
MAGEDEKSLLCRAEIKEDANSDLNSIKYYGKNKKFIRFKRIHISLNGCLNSLRNKYREKRHTKTDWLKRKTANYFPIDFFP